MDKQGMEFWMFRLGNSKLSEFYEEHKGDASVYYAVVIETLPSDIPEFMVDVLQLKPQVVLFIKGYLLPIYNRFNIDGYVIALTENFCPFDGDKTLLKLLFFNTGFGGIAGMDLINDTQKKCIKLCYDEYCSTYDNLQSQVIRNIIINAILLSDVVNFDNQLKAGHLLNIALQFMVLADQYALTERKKSFYVEQLSVTTKLFDASLQAIFNKTFRDILNGRIIIETLYQLAFTDKSVSQIARDLNYDVSDFNRIFIGYKGVLPSEERIKLKKVIDYVQHGY